jgi:lipid-binding SYLF domain-containing protein
VFFVSFEANHVLQTALNPGIRGIPKGFLVNCAGICILSTVQAGFIFSGAVGSGIFMPVALPAWDLAVWWER